MLFVLVLVFFASFVNAMDMAPISNSNTTSSMKGIPQISFDGIVFDCSVLVLADYTAGTRGPCNIGYVLFDSSPEVYWACCETCVGGNYICRHNQCICGCIEETPTELTPRSLMNLLRQHFEYVDVY